MAPGDGILTAALAGTLRAVLVPVGVLSGLITAVHEGHGRRSRFEVGNLPLLLRAARIHRIRGEHVTGVAAVVADVVLVCRVVSRNRGTLAERGGVGFAHVILVLLGAEELAVLSPAERGLHDHPLGERRLHGGVEERREIPVIGIAVHGKSQSDRFQTRKALDLMRFRPGLIQGGQQHRRQNRDDRNYIDLKKLIPYVNLWQNCIYKAFLSPVNTL